MRIKNEYIKINNGEKQIKITNMILNAYLEQIINNQINLDPNTRASLKMTNVYIKFDEQLEFDETTTLTESDFDIKVGYFSANTNITQTQIILNYFYKLDNSRNVIRDIATGDYIENLSSFLNKKIGAIGFGGILSGEPIIYACVNTYNYNIYIESIDTVFSIARRDIVNTDSIFYCKDNFVDGAIHLCDGQDVFVDYFPEKQYIGILKSIGLGVIPQKIDEEISLTPYENHLTITNNEIQISDELTIEYYSDGLFPALDLYPSTNLYPARIINTPLYPSTDIYPGINVYMLEVPYNYIQLKYEIYEQDTIDGTITDTNKFYILSNLVSGKEKIKMNIKYESI